MIVTSNLIQTPKVVTIDQNRWSRSVKFTGHDLLEWVVTVDQNTHFKLQVTINGVNAIIWQREKSFDFLQNEAIF
jgi:hypothetical protein